ncbi:MAG: hypothetical protein EI684_23405 [Candidatus Viridilinea halotolerans]|uniref:Alpha-L-rhamnosidase C-terminal domain-containing protein n=1 Tax=Candidatus Viridilinea halotolerans TaxID=2491704 RepID=A0A426TQ80_9CHLR|nr:MAG: hypothetical protein EI684_23405 [Candidatus Viridilinea halotolerans]
MGRIDDGIAIIDRFFGALIDRGAVTWWENFIADRPNRYSDSFSHAWGGSPTWFLSTYALGAQRTGPTTWQVRYQPSQLRTMVGRLPLNSAVLMVQWQIEPCRQRTLTLNAPFGHTGEIILPEVSQTNELRLNGTVIWQNGQIQSESRLRVNDNQFILSLGSGEYTLGADVRCP